MERETNQHLEPRKKKKVLWIVIVVLLLAAATAVGVVFMMDYINNQPTTYIDENGDKVTTLSRNEMEEAYEDGVSYFEEKNYENAIMELRQVTDKSSKYEEAQQVYVEAMEAYANKWIGQAEVQLESENYEAALAIVESGMDLLGEDAAKYGKIRDILETLKADMLAHMAEAEKKQDYTQAFFCVRIVKECLPEDVEAQTNYDRLHAMSTAQTALAEAEAYVEDEIWNRPLRFWKMRWRKSETTELPQTKSQRFMKTTRKTILSSSMNRSVPRRRSLNMSRLLNC